ncbi:ABC transporter substrate-binding protein [Devosia sp. PTR5]|uniref:ABC transporter substrate-binding protein n=1 Tax=Devosia oryzisoli TaxID=2774138 RepID=A0A927FXI4_9HYPH|nr:extracellular solute-binding protein [Devosia oryzisoli]MBD8066728.1 ABC transporter substrate-binding protein [Devosia oryzisoli]
MTLRSLFKTMLLGALVTLGLSAPALAQSPTGVWVHAASVNGTPKYPEGFSHFDYVNVDAPKTGLLRLSARGSFDTFNPLLPKGQAASGLGLVYETLFTSSLDEVNVSYGLLADAMKIADDYTSVTFRLNPEAKWHDGEPVTAEDVVWSFNKLVELNPNVAQYYADVTGAEVTAPGEVTFTFKTGENRELPDILGQTMVLPQHWWEGTDESGKQRDIGQSTLEPPMGSGPYELSSFEAGKTVRYTLADNYWGKDHPTEIGANNIAEIRYEYFLDESVTFEAFKGDQIDFWSEYISRRWATAYDFPAVTDGRVVREEFPQDYAQSGEMTGFIFNMRRDKFKDERVREALNYAFDFEQLNATVFFNQYQRIDSYFFNLPFASKGLPEGQELDILQSIKDKVPARVFTEPYSNPVSGDPGKLRENLRTALGLLTEAGYRLDGSRLVDANGTQLSFEILMHQPTLEPIATNLKTNLGQIGIAVSIRMVDTPQYINRLRSFDYDMIYGGWDQSFSPGNEQRYFFGSSTVDDEGAQNYAGIADPGVDALITKLIAAKDRDTQLAAVAALDRVLLANHYVIPGYALTYSRTARWNRYSHPEPVPEFSSGFPTIWWWDADKAAKTGGGE